MADFSKMLQETFPGALAEEDYIRSTYEALQPHGFTADNTIIFPHNICYMSPANFASYHFSAKLFNKFINRFRTINRTD